MSDFDVITKNVYFSVNAEQEFNQNLLLSCCKKRKKTRLQCNVANAYVICMSLGVPCMRYQEIFNKYVATMTTSLQAEITYNYSNYTGIFYTDLNRCGGVNCEFEIRGVTPFCGGLDSLDKNSPLHRSQ